MSGSGGSGKKIRRMAIIGHDNDGSLHLLETVLAAYGGVDKMMVLTTGLYYKRSLVSSIWKMIREADFFFCLARAVELFKYKLRGRSLKSVCVENGIPIFQTGDVNDPNSLAVISEFRPDIIVSLYTMHIYRRDIINLAPLGLVTSHPSLIPEYRGLEVFFWVLANNETKTGVTVFFPNEKIDQGAIILQEVVEITPEDTMQSLYDRQAEVAGRLLVEAIRRIDDGTVETHPPQGKGAYFPMPTREAVRRFRKLGRRFQ